ncbi:hypothetical protein BDZ45DRAFT_261047 [Acephala macrosclerotiorum]|nr:hypothetical protein BDZ45DRAFT_261047 [Acephala macrosclerotiorum]
MLRMCSVLANKISGAKLVHTVATHKQQICCFGHLAIRLATRVFTTTATPSHSTTGRE